MQLSMTNRQKVVIAFEDGRQVAVKTKMPATHRGTVVKYSHLDFTLEYGEEKNNNRVWFEYTSDLRICSIVQAVETSLPEEVKL